MYLSDENAFIQQFPLVHQELANHHAKNGGSLADFYFGEFSSLLTSGGDIAFGLYYISKTDENRSIALDGYIDATGRPLAAEYSNEVD